jgi:hypothetical protein
MTRREFVERSLRGAAVVAAGPAGARVLAAEPATPSQPPAAARASDFLDSIGVVSSVTGRGETLAGTVEALRYAGIRWVRCGLEDRIAPSDLIELHRRSGARVAYGLLSGGTDLPRLIDEARLLAPAGALLALEGNNEPNNWGITYRGEAGGRDRSWLPVARLQADLYRAVKGDPALRHLPVWNISESGAQVDNVGLQFLKVPDGAATRVPVGTTYADFANCHNYITHPSWPGLHDNQTWLSASPGPDCPVDGLFGNYGSTWRNHFAGYPASRLATLPRVTTETGYPVGGPVTEEIQARLFMNLYLSQFARGWSHTAIYLLRTRSNETAHDTYSIFGLDYAPKQAAHYLHNLTTILHDDFSAFTPAQLSYSIPDQPATVHDLLLQKSNGDTLLVLWGERFAGGSDRVTVELGGTHGEVRVFDPTRGTSPARTLTHVRSVELELRDHPVIVEVRAAGSLSTGKPFADRPLYSRRR